MRIITILAVFTLVATSVASYMNNGFAWILPGSHLGIVDKRIGGVTSELRRGNAELNANIKAFVACGPDCKNRTEIFAKREALVRKAWPRVFDRLVVESDWGKLSDTRGDHESFREALALYGREQLRNSCLPVIEYIWWGNTPEVRYRGEYHCTG